MSSTIPSTEYRYPEENLTLSATLFVIVVIVFLTASFTLATSILLIGGLIAVTYFLTVSHHDSLVQTAVRINEKNLPNLKGVVDRCAKRLQPGPYKAYVARKNVMNAYAFGLDDPKVIVLYAPLLQVMDSDELTFIVGHEMGHVALGHTWWNSLLGGLAGVPSPYGAAVALNFAFRGWNRMCEFSADRAGLLACGKLDKAVSALVKLSAGPQALDPNVYRRALEWIESEDDSALSMLRETLSTHPMVVRRIQQLHRFEKTKLYKNMKTQMDQKAVKS